MPNFVKVSKLSSEDRTKIKDYFEELWGKEFAQQLTVDFTPDKSKKESGKKKD